MNVPRRVALAWIVFAFCVAGFIANSWLAWAIRDVEAIGTWTGGGDFVPNFLFGLTVMMFPIVGVLVAVRRPENPIGWLLLAIGVAWMLPIGNYGTYAAVNDLPLAPWALGFSQWLWVPAVGLLGTFILLLFPDGHLPSPRWRWLGWLTAFALTMSSLVVLLYPGQLDPSPIVADNPFGVEALRPIIGSLTLVILLVPVCVVASAVALVMRFRRSRGIEREQMKWLTFAAALVATVYLFVMAASLPYTSSGSVQPGWLNVAQDVASFSFWLIPVAIGIAVLRYRLWDINVVISKTVVFGLLVVFITVVYVAVVVGIGTLLGDPRNPALSIAATALVALLFGPVRERVRRFANRLVYGKRATPYEVMAGFAHRVSGSLSVDQILPEMAEVAARGVGARAASVRVTLPNGEERSRMWPDDAEGPFDRSLDVNYQGDPIGAIDVAMPPDEPLRPSEEHLLKDLAGQAGLALHNVRLTEELAVRARELAVQAEGLRISRERLVTARDAQRRGLERDIREGPERQLEAIRQDLNTVGTEDSTETGAHLETLTARATDTLEGLRDLARGIFPPLLADQGVVPALEAHIRKVGAHAEIHATHAFTEQRFDADVEACLYFCCLQAIQNVMRHAENVACTISLEADGPAIRFSLEDRGAGFDPATTGRGMGMDIMQDRIDALDGELVVTSSPGGGTTIAGLVPIHPPDELAGGVEART